MLDIDHFKKVNDTYGHLAGDTVLAGVARVIAKKLRDTDLLGRYGGEEFTLLATPMEYTGAIQLAERIRALVEGHEFTYDAHRIKVTVSIGVSTWQPSMKDNYEEMVRQADSALYSAKEAGRNRVCC
jgi:diguanylate cyclase (GGDEF)-like protein